MRHATFRQLEVFEAIAQFGSFTRAADALFLTQPTVSMQIKKLTQAIGLPLFEQVGKKVYLTAAGQELHKTAAEIFGHLDRFEMMVNDLKGLKRGMLRLAAVSTAKYFAPRLFGAFCQQYPGVDVSLKVGNREEILERLVANEDDLYILGQPPEGVDVESRPFLENPLVALAPLNHSLAKMPGRVPLQRLAEAPFLVREPGSGTRIATERLFARHGLTLTVRMELGSNEAIKQAISAGLGVSVLSRHTLPAEGAAGIAVLVVEGFPIARHWHLIYPKGKRLSVVAQSFSDFVMAHAATLVSAGKPAPHP